MQYEDFVWIQFEQINTLRKKSGKTKPDLDTVELWILIIIHINIIFARWDR